MNARDRKRKRRAESSTHELRRLTGNEPRNVRNVQRALNLNDQARQALAGNSRYTPPRPKR